MKTEKLKTDILICCYSYLLSEGVRSLLADEEDFNIVGTCSSAGDVGKCIKSNADVILTDLDTFFNLYEIFSYKHKSKVLLLCNTSRYASINRKLPDYISMGVAGIVYSHSDANLLKKAIKSVSDGELWIDRNSVKEIISRRELIKDHLTKQEKVIASYICKGLRNKEIATELDISEMTVKSHCNRIYKKVGVSDRLQLALYISRTGEGVEEHYLDKAAYAE